MDVCGFGTDQPLEMFQFMPPDLSPPAFDAPTQMNESNCASGRINSVMKTNGQVQQQTSPIPYESV